MLVACSSIPPTKLRPLALSVLLARVARHAPAALKDFAAESGAQQALARKPACWKGLDASAKARLQEDVRYAVERAARP